LLKPRRFIPVLIVAAGIWAYHNSFQGPFIFDDVTSIAENPHIRHLWPTGEAASRFVDRTVAGRPVARLTLALNYALGGLDVRGYHAFNLAVHLLSALVVYGILRRTFEGEKLRDRVGTAATWLAAAIALIWEVHPLQTESVTYIVERTESLMGLFLLLTLYCFIRGVESQDWPRGPDVGVGVKSTALRHGVEGGGSAGAPKAFGIASPSRTSPSKMQRIGWGQPTLHRQMRLGWFCLSVVSCLLGMGSKEVMVVAPVIVLLYDRVFLADSFWELWQRRAGLYIGLAATWLVLAVLVASTPRSATGVDIKGLTPRDYLMTEAGVIVYYLRLCFWPHPLVIDYFDWPIARSLRYALLPGVVVVGLLGATVWAFRRRPWLGFLGAWFFLILAPTSSFLPSAGEAVAERRMYLPLAAVITMTVVGVFAPGRRLWNKRQGTALGCAATACVVALFGLLTIQRNRDYHSALTIWRDSVDKRPSNPRAHSNLGSALEEAGRIQEAIEQLEQALRINPSFADAHYNLGHAFAQLGQERRAVEQYEQAVRIKPDFAEAHNNLGVVLEQAGLVPKAIAHYEKALQTDPDYADAHYNLGHALAQLGHVQGAVEQYEQALRLKPDYVEAHNNLGIALIRQGRLQEAIVHFDQALRLQPDSAVAQNNLGLTLIRVGSVQEAIERYQQALRIKPDFAQAHYYLGVALEQAGRVREAIGHYEQALRIDPNYVKAHNSLGAAFLQVGRAPEAISHWGQALKINPDFVEAQSNLARARAAQ
jgi:tetratricopeptide (TPR) repeat protein